MTSLKLLHDVKKRTAFISACKCARELISFSFLWFLWWLNSTWLLSSYLHDGITSQNDGMTSFEMLYLSQLVDVLERWFLFCFYSILGCQVHKYHWFCIFTCGNVKKLRYDVMAWLYDVTKLTQSRVTCGGTRQMIRSLPVYTWLFGMPGNVDDRSGNVIAIVLARWLHFNSDVMIMTSRYEITNLISLILAW